MSISPALAAVAEQKLLAHQFAAQKLERERSIEKARIEKAEDLARRAAALSDIKRLRPQPENRSRLNAAARRAAEKLGLAALKRLAGAAHDVYSAIRTAVVRGYAGLKASAQELADHLGMSKSTFWRAMRVLRRLKLVGFTENYEASGAFTDIKTRKTYRQQRIENTFWIGHAAPQRDFRMCLEAEGRAPSRKESRTPARESPSPVDQSTGFDTTPQCQNEPATPRLRQGEGDSLAGVLDSLREGARPSDECGPANRGTFAVQAPLSASGFAGAEKGERAHSGPSREFRANWLKATLEIIG